jgi:hypothetical protein
MRLCGGETANSGLVVRVKLPLRSTRERIKRPHHGGAENTEVRREELRSAQTLAPRRETGCLNFAGRRNSMSHARKEEMGSALRSIPVLC